MVERGSSPGDYLATSVDQVVTLLFAKYAGEVVKAQPSDKAYPPRSSENARSDNDNVCSSGAGRDRPEIIGPRPKRSD
jgi:hypothetical protein